MDKQDIKKIAINSYNETWELIDKPNRTPDENLKMIELAYKSKYNWSLIGSEINFVRSDWQVSRVYAEAKIYDAALYYAKKCLKDTLKLDLEDFDLFFAYEANVRVYHLMKDFDLRDDFVDKAIKSLDTIEKQADKDYCKSELDKIFKL